MHSDLDKTLRRIVVESIINISANSQANFQLVSVIEGQIDTTMEFELYHPLRDIHNNVAKRVHITIGTEISRETS
jgi:hypothetical protein